MSLNLEIDNTSYALPELILPEKIYKPIELMSYEEYITHLNYLKSEELPELSDSVNIIVDKLSKEYSKVMFGGKYQIMQESINDVIEFHMPNEIKQFNKDLKIPYMKGDKRHFKQIFEAFEESTEAPKFGRVDFNPSQIGDYGKTKNLFRGFPLEDDRYIPLDVDLILASAEDIQCHVDKHYPNASRVIEHLFNNIADGNVDLAIQILAFIADILQNPDKSPMVALILKSADKGTGKSLFAEVIKALVGKRLSFTTSHLDKIIGRFNDHLIDKLVVVGEEISFGGSHDTNDKIKDLITSSHQSIEPKFKAIIQVRKYFRLVLCTNKDWAVNASSDERRYIIADVASHQAQNDEYFAPIHDNGVIKKTVIKDLFDFLKSLDYSDIDLSKGVETEGMKSQKRQSMPPIEQWWDCCLEDDRIGDNFDGNMGSYSIDNKLIPKGEVHNAYLKWLDKTKPNDKTRVTNSKVFGRNFLALARGKNKNLINSERKDVNNNHCYDFGSIEELKKYFDSRF